MSDSKQNVRYEKQVQLLIDILPIVMRDPRFALKGGTAINLFVRNLPRFSIDIDLTYLPVEPRAQTIANVDLLLEKAAKEIEQGIRGSRVVPSRPFDSGRELKLIVERESIQVKVEANYILRGSVFPCMTRELMPECRSRFAASVSVNVMSLADLYGGKICAALDRQHPRDLFDIRLLLQNEGITDEIRHAFLVYLMSHNRPMNELLEPRWQDLTEVFAHEFFGMTAESVSFDDLLEARGALLPNILGSMTDAERELLLGFKCGAPDWSLFPYPHVQSLPGIQWKLKNLAEMTPAKRTTALRKLKAVLGRARIT